MLSCGFCCSAFELGGGAELLATGLGEYVTTGFDVVTGTGVGEYVTTGTEEVVGTGVAL